MSKWTRVTLEQIANISAGQNAPQGKNNYSDYGTPFIKAGNLEFLTNGGSEDEIQKVNDSVAKSHNLKLFCPGTIVFAKSGMSCMKGYVYVLKNSCYVVNHLACVTPININSNYLRFYFMFQKPNKLVKDEAYPSISLTDISSLEIPLPPMETQKQIAKTLDTVSELLAMRKQQLIELDNLIKSVFYDMFGDPIKNTKGWERKELSNCCYVNPKKSEMNCFTDNLEVSFVSMASVSEKGDINTNEIKLYKEVKAGFTYFYENDVLFAKITPCMENGKGAIARGLKNNIGFGSTEFHVLRPKNGISNSEWLYHLTALPVFRDSAEKNMTGSAGQKRVPVSFFDKFFVPLPPISLQDEFATIVTKIEAQKSLVKKSIEETQLLFDSLMSQYFDE